jgi:hypothetical protein
MDSALALITSILAPLSSGRAYLDPGSGSFILQLLIAALLGGLFIIKAYWQKIVRFFRNLFSRGGGDSQE